MKDEKKTNAMRILDRKHIEYDVLYYDCPEFTDGIQVAEIEGVPYEESFKTLVAIGKTGAYYVFVIPIESEVDLKAAAKAVGEKSVHMLPLKDLTRVTGYVRGGCTPLGMKKAFPVVLSQNAKAFSKIYISGGRIGATLHLSPDDLLSVCQGKYGDITI